MGKAAVTWLLASDLPLAPLSWADLWLSGSSGRARTVLGRRQDQGNLETEGSCDDLSTLDPEAGQRFLEAFVMDPRRISQLVRGLYGAVCRDMYCTNVAETPFSPVLQQQLMLNKWLYDWKRAGVCPHRIVSRNCNLMCAVMSGTCGGALSQRISVLALQGWFCNGLPLVKTTRNLVEDNGLPCYPLAARLDGWSHPSGPSRGVDGQAWSQVRRP